MARNGDSPGYFTIHPADPPHVPRTHPKLTEEQQKEERARKQAEQRQRVEVNRVANFKRYKAGALEGRQCECGMCWPFLSMLGDETRAKVVKGKANRVCSCAVCKGAELDSAVPVVCVCPVCMPWVGSEGKVLQAPVEMALSNLDGQAPETSRSHQMVAASVEGRKVEQSRLMAKVLEVGEPAIDFLRLIIQRGTEDPEFMKTAARASIDLLRLGLPIGWDKEEDPAAHTRFLGELKDTMAEYRVLLEAQMRAKAAGVGAVPSGPVVVVEKRGGD